MITVAARKLEDAEAFAADLGCAKASTQAVHQLLVRAKTFFDRLLVSAGLRW